MQSALLNPAGKRSLSVSYTHLCAAEKDAAGIDGVYYYTGDYTGIETLESGELEQLIGSTTLLWNP